MLACAFPQCLLLHIQRGSRSLWRALIFGTTGPWPCMLAVIFFIYFFIFFFLDKYTSSDLISVTNANKKHCLHVYIYSGFKGLKFTHYQSFFSHFDQNACSYPNKDRLLYFFLCTGQLISWTCIWVLKLSCKDRCGFFCL